MDEEKNPIGALRELAIAQNAIYTARDKIHLVSHGYEYATPTRTFEYLAQIAGWLHELQQMLEAEARESGVKVEG